MCGLTEPTVLLTMDLPHGREFAVLCDCNTLVIDSKLDQAGRERAIVAACAQWRRNLSVVA